MDEARTWIEETGLCLFLPRKQFTSSVAPSFVEAIAGHREATPSPQQIATAEELLVRLENDGIAVRLNLSGQPGEQPDFIVAAWVLPYVYALRGDRDWRRIPQLTGSRAVSPLAVQAYKLLEANDSTISQLKQGLGREVSEAAVVRAITELWQQLRIIPSIAAPGQPAKWQLLRHRYQKAIAEGASTSQVTAISVLASIFLQAVIAASMEEVELFLAALTARSKIREVLRGLVATRQVHTITLGHAPHFYVAGTLPEFAPSSLAYAGGAGSASAYYPFGEQEESRFDRPFSQQLAFASPTPVAPARPAEAPRRDPEPVPESAEASAQATPVRPHFARPAHPRARKPVANRPGQSGTRRPAEARPSASRSANGARSTNSTRWNQNGHHAAKPHAGTSHSGASNGSSASPARNGKSSGPSWTKRNGHATANQTASKSASISRKSSLARKESRVEARSSRNGHKPALTAGAKAGNGKRFGFTARANKGTKKRG